MTIAVDTETTGLFIHKGCRPFMITAADDQNKTYVWEFEVNPNTREVIYDKKLLKNFKETISEHKELVFHNANFDMQALVAVGFSLEELFNNHDIHDTMVMSHAYRSTGPHGLKELGVSILDFPSDDEKRLGDITKSARDKAKKIGWCIADAENPHPSIRGLTKEIHKSDYWVPKQVARKLNIDIPEWYTICEEYAINDVIRTLALFKVFPEMMDQEQLDSYYKNIRTVLSILRMQYEGIQMIEDKLIESTVIYQSKVSIGKIKLEQLSGIPKFNPDSPKQLKEVLFERLKFTTEKTTNTGQMSTDKKVISELLSSCPTTNPLPNRYQFLVELKTWRKAKTTLGYLGNYLSHRINNRLHPNFKLTGTNTGRLSSENPNTTNVGKTDMNNPFVGKEADLGIELSDDSFKLRNVFGPTQGNMWTCIDYSQFQLLIFAVASGSDELVEAYLNGIDLHHAVAAVIFGTDDISSVQRTAAKAINFGILFGAGPAKIEETAGMPGLYGQFLRQLPGAKKYLAAQEKLARELGYVHTLGGYRLYPPKERPYAASCYAIQGTEAEIVKDAMCNISDYCYHTNWLIENYHHFNQNPRLELHTLARTRKPCNYKMIMMVHDELVFEHKVQSEPHLRNIMRMMENAGRAVGVPVKVDAKLVTSNWADKTPIALSI